MTHVKAATRLSVMLFQFTFQGYRLCDCVKKGLQNKIIINPTSCVLRLTSISGISASFLTPCGPYQDRCV